MSVDRILTMVDTSAKSTDPLVYKLNLLTRTMKTDDKVLIMVEKIHNILICVIPYLENLQKY